jgi:hypothetical protein
MTIRRINPLSCAKVGGLLYALIGLVIGALISLFALAIGTAAQMEDEAGGALVGMLFGAGAIIIMPVFYGMLGAVGAVVSALVYNFVAGFVGGIEIEVS